MTPQPEPITIRILRQLCDDSAGLDHIPIVLLRGALARYEQTVPE